MLYYNLIKFNINLWKKFLIELPLLSEQALRIADFNLHTSYCKIEVGEKNAQNVKTAWVKIKNV
jgi:hypothetical protein